MTDSDIAILFTIFLFVGVILLLTTAYLLTLRFAPPLARLERRRQQSPAIEVTVAHSPLAFIYRWGTPTIEINGRKEQLPWGQHRFQLPPGDYEISVSYQWLKWKGLRKNTVRCRLDVGQVRHVKYRAGFDRGRPGTMTVV